MSSDETTQTLALLVELREREVERLSADIADKRATRERYMRNLERLEQLSSDCGPSSTTGAASQPRSFAAALSLNNAGYKQVVTKMADTHRLDLGLHEADMAVTQRSLAEAARRHEALDLILRRKEERIRRNRARREQRRQDETASQMWWLCHK
jgi:flagellar export protein FliJ